MPNLSGLQVAVLATHGVEESELTEPVAALSGAGATASIISLQDQPLQAFRHFDKSKLIECSAAQAAATADSLLNLPWHCSYLRPASFASVQDPSAF